MDEPTYTRLHAIIEGDVQGVGFRYFVLSNAQSLGIAGWVRNRYDGSVEVLAQGARPILEVLIDALYQGPRSARVSTVDIEWQPAENAFTGFEIRYS